MSQSSTPVGRRTPTFWWGLSVLLFALEEVILIPGLAAFLVGYLLTATGLAERMTPLAWFVAAPALYCLWVLAYLSICALHIQLLFRGYSKPRHAVLVDGMRESAPHIRLGICYGRAYMVKSLPMLQSLITLPILRNLFLLSYSPRFKLGDRFVLAGFLYDPDLIEIGDDVIVGGGCVMAAHAHVVLRPHVQLYVSAPIRICNRATVGGESRIAMGVTIGTGAVVESYSNVVALTNIGPGEVWGGSPAVLLRRRTDLTSADAAVKSAPDQRIHDTNGKAHSKPAAVEPGTLDRARRVVARALDQSPDAVSSGDWDSLQQLAIALMLEEECGRRPLGERIFEMRSLADVARAIDSVEVPASLPSGSVASSRTSVTAADPALPASAAGGDSVDGRPTDPEWLPLLPFSAAAHCGSSEARSFAGDPVSVVVASNFQAEPLGFSLRQWSSAFGIDARVQFCDFSQISRELLSPDSLLRGNRSGLNVVLVRPEDLGDLPDDRAAAARELIAAIRHFVAQQGASVGLCVGSFPAPPLSASGAERQALESLRTDWASHLATIEGVEVFDFGAVVGRVGSGLDDDASQSGDRAAYSDEIYRELGIELARVVRRRRRSPAKVLALEADSVLWGGAIAEDGMDGIRLGATGRGRSFQSFQRALIDLKHRGVLLVVVSQNEEPDVWNVFDKHPGMILRRQDIAAWRINWNSKADNLQQLADELNVELGSIVYIDADAAHRREVEAQLPEVHVFPTPTEPVQYAPALSRLWIFDAPHIPATNGVHTVVPAHERESAAARRG